MKALTDDTKEISKALQYSTLLKLSEDGTRVSRIAPFVPRSNDEVDLCTIYVVCIILTVRAHFLAESSRSIPTGAFAVQCNH